MKIVWDEPKRQANLVAHGMDFADVERFPWTRAIIRQVRHGRHGNPRFQAIGALDGRLVAIVFGRLGSQGVSVISMRLASHKERQLHVKTQSLRSSRS